MYPVARAAVLAPHLAFAHVVASHATALPTALPFNGVTPTNQAGIEIVTVRADADICRGCETETCIGKLKTSAAMRILPESSGMRCSPSSWVRILMLISSLLGRRLPKKAARRRGGADDSDGEDR